MHSHETQTLDSIDLPSPPGRERFDTPDDTYFIRAHSADSWTVIRNGGSLVVDFVRRGTNYVVVDDDGEGDLDSDWRRLVRCAL